MTFYGLLTCPYEFFLWGYLKIHVNEAKLHALNELKTTILHEKTRLCRELRDSVDQMTSPMHQQKNRPHVPEEIFRS